MENINGIESFLDELDEMVESAVSLPLSKGRCLMDSEAIRAVVDDIRLNLPKEIKQANSVIAERDEII